MRKKWYYLLSILIMALLFSFNVSAANTLSYTDEYNLTSGETIKGRGDTFSAIVPDNYDEYTWDIAGTVAEWNINENFNIVGLSKNKYYNGYLNLNFNLSPSWVSSTNTSTITKDEPILTSTYIKEGLSCYLYRSGNYYTVTITFENYYSGNDTWIGLPTITQKFYSTNYNPPSGVYPNINIPFSYFTLSNYSNLISTNDPKNIGEIGELNDILEYLKNRPTKPYDFQTGAALFSGDELYLTRNSNFRYVVINKSDLIKYIYFSAFGPNQHYHILYFNDLPNLSGSGNVDLTNYFTRGVKATKSGLQYMPINFEYGEEYAIINFGGTRELYAYIGEGYTYDALLYYINKMEEMTPEQSSEAAEIESEYAERDEQSQQLLTGMNSLNMPSISAGDLDILGNVDGTQKINFMSLIGLITHTPIITQIMLIITIGAIVGFILYGKK